MSATRRTSRGTRCMPSVHCVDTPATEGRRLPHTAYTCTSACFYKHRCRCHARNRCRAEECAQTTGRGSLGSQERGLLAPYGSNYPCCTTTSQPVHASGRRYTLPNTITQLQHAQHGSITALKVHD